MKKSLCILASLMLITGFAMADFEDYNTYDSSQGFQDNNTSSPISVKQVLRMRDDSIATVRGNIVKRLSDDKYLFRDSTGTIAVEIDYKYWAGVKVGLNDTVELSGKLDKDYNEIEFEVFSIKKVK